MNKYEITLNLNNIENVRKFIQVTNKCTNDVDVFSNDRKYIIDGKSIMGIFSLDLSKRVIVSFKTIEDRNFVLKNLDTSFTPEEE